MITRIAKALTVVNLINVRFGKARGRKASDLLRGTTNALATERQPILSLRGISKRFRGIQALENVNLDLCDKEILGLLGDNGAGRSALIEVIAGVYGVDEGRAIFEGKDIDIKGRDQEKRSNIGIIRQELPFLLCWMFLRISLPELSLPVEALAGI